MGRHTCVVVLVWTVVLLTLTGCRRALPDPASPAPPIKDAGSPPSEAEAKEFAERMTKAVQARDAAAIDQLVRMEDLHERLISDLGLSTSERQAWLDGRKSFLQQANWGQQILQSIKDDGSYKLLRIRTVDGRPLSLFRMIQSDGGLNYHEYILARHKDGKVAAEDIYIYLSAEPISQTMRRLLIPAVATLQGKSGPGKINSQEVSSLKTFGTMAKAVRSGDFKSAITAYRTLPKKNQEEKPTLLLYIHATMNLGADGEADYLAALEMFRQLYPNDAAVDFISIDYFFLKKRYDEARHSIDQLGKAVGGDPYLDVLRGNAWMEAGRFEEARQAMEKAIQQEPDLANAYWARITLSLREKKYADTLKWLQTVVEKCHYSIPTLHEIPEYADFVTSPQYGEWQKWYADRSKGNN